MAQENELVILENEPEPSKLENEPEQMGDDEFETLEEIDNGTTKVAQSEGEEEQEQKKKKIPKKIIFIAAGGGAFVLILIIVILLLVLGGKKEPVISIIDDAPVVTQEKLDDGYYKLDRGRIEEMLSKANSLYERGDRSEALKIYENVAIYNESLSYYNLGVSQMNQEKFDQALDSFKRAIANQEHTDVSALNAAVCALHLGDQELFKYYIDLSRAFLTPNSSVYSYYSALVNYYGGYYIEAYHILNSIEDGFYINNAKYLKSKILSLIRRDKDAIDALSEIKEYDTHLPLGLLNARLGNYEEAIAHLNRVDPLSINIDIAHLARALIQLKIGSYLAAANSLENINDNNATFIHDTYPIKAALKDDYFNIDAAQTNFDEQMFFYRNSIYAMLFYYTPFKAFDAKQTMDYITKGAIGVFVAQSEEADEYLQTSGLISQVNINLSKAISKAVNNELREANTDFAKLVKEYPEHAILQYNLALSYAQLGDYASAYKHFVISYHLNPKNHLAGTYAVICAQIIGREHRHLHAEVVDNINADTTLKGGNFYESLLLYSRGNTGALARWLDEGENDTTLKVVFSYISAMVLNQREQAGRFSDELFKKLPNDIMTVILHFLAHNDQKQIKEYAQNIQVRFFHSSFDLSTLYGGSSIVKVQFVKLLQLSGLADVWRDIVLIDLQAAQNKDKIRHALAYIDLFTNRHEEAFEIYNDLVHNKQMQDARTLFLAAVASIGSGHPQNAVAYLELAKLTNPTDPGNRIALGLLYQELGNIPAAVAQYKSVGNTDYKSQFFTFHLANRWQ